MESRIKTIHRIAKRELKQTVGDMVLYNEEDRKDLQRWRDTMAAIVRVTGEGKDVPDEILERVHSLARTETIGRRLFGLT